MNVRRYRWCLIATGLLLLGSIGHSYGQTKGSALRYVEAQTLTVIGKAQSSGAPFQRLDTARYKLWNPVKSYATYSTGLAIVFRTNSSIIEARWRAADTGPGHIMSPAGRMGLDLYIERDGEWVFAGLGRANGGESEHVCALAEYMNDNDKLCLLYLPLWSTLERLEIGVAQGATIEAAPNPFRHKVVVLGSSITHGAAASRTGMTYTARMSRDLGIEFLNLGFSGQCKLQPEYAKILAETEADAFLFDAFSNPNAKEIAERLEPFVRTIRAAHPQTPLIFIQTEVREITNFNERRAKSEADKRKAAEQGVRALMKQDKHIYFIDSKAMIGVNHLGTIDGTHPTDEGFSRMVEHLEPRLRKILRRYDIR